MTKWAPYGWIAYYPDQIEPFHTIPAVGYFLENAESHNRWPITRCKTQLSFWLGRDGVPENLQ